MTQYTYEYAPYTGEDGTEIPAFEIFNEVGEKVAETNEHLPASQQEEVATLLCNAARVLEVLKMAQDCFGQHNLLSTATDEERRVALARFSHWWNELAVPAIEDFDIP